MYMIINLYQLRGTNTKQHAEELQACQLQRLFALKQASEVAENMSVCKLYVSKRGIILKHKLNAKRLVVTFKISHSSFPSLKSANRITICDMNDYYYKRFLYFYFTMDVSFHFKFCNTIFFCYLTKCSNFKVMKFDTLKLNIHNSNFRYRHLKQ